MISVTGEDLKSAPEGESDSDADADSASEAPAYDTSTQALGGSAIDIACRAAVWVDIRNAGGEKLYYQVCEAGTQARFDVSGELSVFVGNASGNYAAP